MKRSRAAGVEQGRRAGRKADGTLDRRLKANRAGRGGERRQVVVLVVRWWRRRG